MHCLITAIALAAAATLASSTALAEVSVVDDAGHRVTLAQPAQRIVALAPHAAELLFAAGAGARVVGVVKFSTFPTAAAKLPQVGDYNQIDIERVLALHPDLLVVWESGNTGRQLNQLRALGIPVFASEPVHLDDIATSILRLGQLAGSSAVAQPAATQFRGRIASLGERYATAPPVRVFYQVWDKPLYTLNGKQIVSDVLRLCGGSNIFARESAKAPQVSVEAVLQANPEVIFSGRQYDATDTGLGVWKTYAGLLAVKRSNLFTVNDENLVRPGPRMAEGAAEVCEKLALARQRRR